MNNVANGWLWLGFSIFVLLALSVDTFFLNKKYARSHVSMKAAWCWSLVWVVSALVFNFLLWFYLRITTTPAFAKHTAFTFFTGYLIEKSLSIDNLFVFYLVFKQMHIPTPLQQRVFSVGIWSAIVLRLLFILAGAYLVSRFHWVLYVMGVFLLVSGFKMFFVSEKPKSLAESNMFIVIKRFFRLTHELHGQSFFLRCKGLLYATPLFVTLIFIEISDIIFAFDSIPAIFAITQDPFIVWSSNIFAILGLRALYFVLAAMINRFSLLKYAIALILMFVGFKMVIEPWWQISVFLSLSVIIGSLLIFTILSFKRDVRNAL